MFDWIPFGGARGIVANGDLQAAFVREFLQAFFVHARSRPVASTPVCFNHQAPLARIIRFMQTPPIDQSVDGQVGSITGSRNTDMTFVSLGIIDAVGRGSALCILREIVGIDRFVCLTPALTGVFELANEFFLLRVDADPWGTLLAKLLAFLSDILELLVAFRMSSTCVERLAMAAQTELLSTKQAANCRRAGPAMKLLRQTSQS